AGEQDKRALTQAALLIGQSKFAEASAQIQPTAPASPAKVYADLAPAPSALRAGIRAAALAAIASWNAALGKTPRLVAVERPEDADVLVLFERDAAGLMNGQLKAECVQTKMDAPKGRRTAAIYVGLFVANSQGFNSATEIP